MHSPLTFFAVLFAITFPAFAQAPPAPSIATMSLTKTVKPFHTLDGISGITFNPRTGTLFCVKNLNGRPGSTFEVTPDGTLLRTIAHTDFEDTEAIAWVTSFRGHTGTLFDVFLLAEEDHTAPSAEGRLSLCLLAATATTLDRDDTNGPDPDNTSVTTVYSGGTMNNKCIEALAFDSSRNLCYYTAEKQTESGSHNTPLRDGAGSAKIFARSVTANATTLAFDQRLRESELCDITPLFTGILVGDDLSNSTLVSGPLFSCDISDMCYSAPDDTILLLSHEGDKLLKITRSGELVETLATPGEQLEGVTLNPSATSLWVTGEDSSGGPGEFFRYETGFKNILTGAALLDFPATAATAVADLTITVPGAAPGDTVAPGIPNESMTPTAAFTAWVSAPDTVTIRFSPKSGENPAPGTFRAAIIRP